jgi:cysteine desulfurase/selenocysteine lyase
MNIPTIKEQFPLFKHHPDLVYLDSAATTLKPQTVIDAVTGYYERYSANVGRGLYGIAEEATGKLEEARAKVAVFIGGNQDEIIFVRNATEGLNLLASTLSTFLFPVIPAHEPESGSRVRPGMTKRNIIVTEMEHHSNYLPWKRIADEHGAEFRTIPIGVDGNIDPTSFTTVIDADTAIVSFSAVSNVLGTKVSVADIVKRIKSIAPDAAVIVDASQVVGHSKIDIAEWGADFVVFSGHKMFGPTGVGIVWGRKALLDKLSPYQLGGGMVADACADIPEYKPAPYRFEAGTPDIASIIGLGAAIDFIESIGKEESVIPGLTRNLDSRFHGNDNFEKSFQIISEHETELTRYAMEKLTETFGSDITIFGTPDPQLHAGLISFTLKGIHPHDLAQILGEKSICIRAGEHCASPIHRKLGLSATARISFSVYNDEQDIDLLIETMKGAKIQFQI